MHEGGVGVTMQLMKANVTMQAMEKIKNKKIMKSSKLDNEVLF